MSDYQDRRNSYQVWRDRINAADSAKNAEDSAKQKLKEDYGRAMSGADSEDPPAETKPKTVEEEVSALREQLSSLQQEMKDRLTPRVVRSTMSNKEKADFIGKHGSAAYFQIPWD